MTWVDLTAGVLLVLVVYLEARRGFCPALTDLLLSGVGLGLAKRWAPDLADSPGSTGTAFLVPFPGAAILAARGSLLLDAQRQGRGCATWAAGNRPLRKREHAADAEDHEQRRGSPPSLRFG